MSQQNFQPLFVVVCKIEKWKAFSATDCACDDISEKRSLNLNLISHFSFLMTISSWAKSILSSLNDMTIFVQRTTISSEEMENLIRLFSKRERGGRRL